MLLSFKTFLFASICMELAGASLLTKMTVLPDNVTLPLVTGIYRDKHFPPECTKKFRDIRQHTMCLTDSAKLVKSGVTTADIAKIVDLHNDFRSRETRAANMEKTAWDDNLARIAEKWAKQCTTEHDTMRIEPDYNVEVGQNLAFGYGSWDAAVAAWYAEKSSHTYGKTQSNFLDVGHYTQLVQDGAVKVGCGYAECNTAYRAYYVCNYIEGNWNVTHPYRRGLKSCSECPTQCKNNLCDCGGKFCFNGGTMQLDSCECRCARGFIGPQCLQTVCPFRCQNGGTIDLRNCECRCYSLYRGPYCNLKFCPYQEPRYCTTSWPPSYCTRFPRAVPLDCPYLCGQCANKPRCKDDSLCYKSSFGCTYYGQRPSKVECSRLGDSGDDKTQCQSKGGTYGCGACTSVANINKDVCPVQCGTCDGQCARLNCSNGGTFNEARCRCDCLPGFGGTTCNAVTCPNLACLNGGTANKTSCRCTCPKDFTGDKCQNKRCIVRTCLNGGTFNEGRCQCDCLPGFGGTTCNAVTCAAFTCLNGGTADRRACVCSCTDDFTGDKCQTRKCVVRSCSNGGTFDSTTCKCVCPRGYGGDRCQRVTCPNFACLNGGTANKTSCRCTCPKDFTGDKCQNKRCTVRTCLNGGTFNETSCQCDCPIGYSGNSCDTVTCSNLTCQNGGTPYKRLCRCICADGFTGPNCQNAACGGLRCDNGGSLDHVTCRCWCHAIYKGERCETEYCPVSDRPYCGMGAWVKDNCGVFVNVPKECPYLCGICTENNRTSCEDDPRCYVSAQGCRYYGIAPEKADCENRYGDRAGQDRYFCASRGGIWGCTDCESNPIVKYHCPWTCGFCRVASTGK